jgi:hypothetical protein
MDLANKIKNLFRKIKLLNTTEYMICVVMLDILIYFYLLIFSA